VEIGVSIARYERKARRLFFRIWHLVELEINYN
jgi:hypothetical protein